MRSVLIDCGSWCHFLTSWSPVIFWRAWKRGEKWFHVTNTDIKFGKLMASFEGSFEIISLTLGCLYKAKLHTWIILFCENIATSVGRIW